jgi:hypothetical protein
MQIAGKSYTGGTISMRQKLEKGGLETKWRQLSDIKHFFLFSK